MLMLTLAPVQYLLWIVGAKTYKRPNVLTVSTRNRSSIDDALRGPVFGEK